jgi:low temperature requirement protein LtrA
MSSKSQSSRGWWRPPRKTIERDEERRVTFLELFYDLVYVVLIAEIGSYLARHVDIGGILTSTFLFVLVWLAWINGTMYHDLHGQNDVRTRIFTFAQMFTVAAMAVFARAAFGAGSIGFALSFAAYQLILTHLWWQTGVHDPDHRPLSRPYAGIFLISAILFAGSAIVPESWRFVLWGVGLFLSVASPLLMFFVRPGDPEVRAELERSMKTTPSSIERFDLFTIIVLGEVIVAVVRGVAGHHRLDWVVGATAALGMLVAIGLWWLYFDFVSHRRPMARHARTFAWMFLHLPVTMGIAATGAAILNVVEHAGESLPSEVRWLLVSTIALALVSIALLMKTLQLLEEHRRLYRTAAIVTIVSAAVIVGLGFSGLATIPLLVALNLLMLLPVLWGLKVWIKVFGAEEIKL